MKETKKKSIATNTVFNVSYKLLNLLFPLITSAYLARILGPESLGKVSYAQSIMSYFLVIASLGIPTYGMREIAKASADVVRRNKVFSELFTINTISTLICSVAYTIMIFTIPQLKTDINLFLCTGLTVYMNIINIDWYFSGMEEYVYITIRSFIIKILSIIAIFLFVKCSSDYVLYALITSIAVTGNYILNVYNAKKSITFMTKSLKLVRHLKPILILFVTIIASDIYMQLDITMLGTMRSQTDVGYYSNGIKLIRMVYSVSMTVGATIIPRMSHYFDSKMDDKYTKLFGDTVKVVLVYSVPACVGVFLLSKEITLCLFGNQFLPTIDIVKILSVSIPTVSISYLIGSVVLTSSNNERYLMRATITGCLINILMNTILIPILGISGAAIASLCSEVAVCLIHAFYGFKYVHRVSLRTDLIQILLSSVIMTLCILIVKTINMPFILIVAGSICAGVFAYVTSLYLMKNTTIRYLLGLVQQKMNSITG